MKILLMSYAYPPSVGGIELFSSLMRAEIAARGHEVRVVTEAAQPMSEDGAHCVDRRPGRAALRAAIAWADLCLVSGVSLRYQIPAVLGGKPLVIVHHGWQEHSDGRVDALQRLKFFACRFGLNVAVNRALAADLHLPALSIPNPVPCPIDLGAEISDRHGDLVFVGRLVSEKGAAVLLDAMALLRDRGRRVNAVVIGDGPERMPLERQAARLGIGASIQFRGRLTPEQIRPILATRKILVVPSVYKEAFGFVVLEGLAAGCVVLGSHAGGLPESIGACGRTFPMGDSAALATEIERLLAAPELAASLRAAIPAHLAAMSLDRVAGRYLEVCQRMVENVAGMTRRKAIALTVKQLG